MARGGVIPPLLYQDPVFPPGGDRSPCYEEDDLERFNEIGKHRPELFDFFMNYYQRVMAAGALRVRLAG
jgi:hypothetical protein